MKYTVEGRCHYKGVSLVETLVASSILIFVLFTSFNVIGSTISKSTSAEKKVELLDQLDNKVNEYLITGTFDTASSSSSISFSETVISLESGSSYYLVEFIGQDSDFNLTVTRHVFKRS